MIHFILPDGRVSVPAFIVCGAALIGTAWALSKWVPAYIEERFFLSGNDELMASRFSAAMAALRRVFGNGPPQPSAMDMGFAAVGAVLIAADYLVIGPTIDGLYAQVFLIGQLALAAICAERDLLPDMLTIPLAATGLALGACGVFVSPADSIWGLLAGAAAPLGAAVVFGVSNGRDGLGEGIIKHAAATGAWLGPLAGFYVLCGSALFGGVIIPFARRMRGADPSASVTFGHIYAAFSAAAFLYSQAAPESIFHRLIGS